MSLRRETLALEEKIRGFLVHIVNHEKIEDVWLATLAMGEQLACEQILSNLTAKLPESMRKEIEAHAMDEKRHAQDLLSMRVSAEPLNSRYEKLEKEFKKLYRSFVVGFFGNPLLTSAQSRHAAYVHGALTIERVPFQIYTQYWKMSKNKAVREHLPDIIREEYAHLALGARFYDDLPEAERLSIEALQKIEIEMCSKLIDRLQETVMRFKTNVETESRCNSILDCVKTNEVVMVAWVECLSFAERTAADAMIALFDGNAVAKPAGFEQHVQDEMRHARILKRSVALERRQFRKRIGYNKLEEELLNHIASYLLRLFALSKKLTQNIQVRHSAVAFALESRVFKHYVEFAKETDHILVSQSLCMILEEEKGHVQMAYQNLKQLTETAGSIRQQIISLEESLWKRLQSQVVGSVQGFLHPGVSDIEHSFPITTVMAQEEAGA